MNDITHFTEEAKNVLILDLSLSEISNNLKGAAVKRDNVSQHLLLPSSSIQILERFKKLGFFQPDEGNYVSFQSRLDLKNKERKIFSLVFGNSRDFMGGGLVVYGEPKHNGGITMIGGILSSFGHVQLNSTEEKIYNRFNTYDFTPKNGWGLMYYLDFITGMTVEWSNEEIQLLDEYKTKGLLMAAAKILINKGIPVSAMEPAIGMPIAWVEKAYGVTK
jgi:hypothetical protein